MKKRCLQCLAPVLGPVAELPELAGTTTTLYHAVPETGTYSHHSHICRHEGTVVAMWSTHLRDEDAPGQRVLMRHSTDLGATWSAITELFPPPDTAATAAADGDGRRTLCANGFTVVNGTLYGFAEAWDNGGWNRREGPGRLARAIGTDGELGPIFWLRPEPPDGRPEFPAWPGGEPALVRAIEAQLRRPGEELTWDFRYDSTQPTADDGHRLCEPTPAWRLADGAWCKLYRDLGKSYRNYVSFSDDDGATWTPPTRTNFPDANARATAGTLPDGRVYVVSNLSPDGRDPLAICLANDGLTFARAAVIRRGAPPIRHEGRWKDRGFQYPHTLVLADQLWVMYSVNKEDIQLTRIPLTAL